MIVRGIGPSLAQFEIPNVLPNPQLELRNSGGTLIRSNDDWMDDPAQAALISGAGLAPSNNLESGIYETLAPGQYTALLSGVNNGTGVGLVEAYDLMELLDQSLHPHQQEGHRQTKPNLTAKSRLANRDQDREGITLPANCVLPYCK